MNTGYSKPAPPLHPLSYERRPADPQNAVFRDGKSLVVNRGADISSRCLCCGQPANGIPIVKHLYSSMGNSHFGSSGGGSDPISAIIAIIELLFLLIALIAFIVEVITSRKRTVTFGLCPIHAVKASNMRLLAWASLVAAAGLIVLGIVLCVHLRQPTTGGPLALCISSFVGGVVMLVLSITAATKIPGLALQKEQGNLLWIKGAGDPLLAAQMPFPALPTATKK